jgi:hypothetical protein
MQEIRRDIVKVPDGGVGYVYMVRGISMQVSVGIAKRHL